MKVRKTLTTNLEKEHISSLNLILKANNWSKRELLANAIIIFESKIMKNGIYAVKFNEFDRLYLDSYQISVFDELFQEVNKLVNGLKIKKPQLIRELLINYLLQNKK